MTKQITKKKSEKPTSAPASKGRRPQRMNSGEARERVFVGPNPLPHRMGQSMMRFAAMVGLGRELADDESCVFSNRNGSVLYVVRGPGPRGGYAEYHRDSAKKHPALGRGEVMACVVERFGHNDECSLEVLPGSMFEYATPA